MTNFSVCKPNYIDFATEQARQGDSAWEASYENALGIDVSKEFESYQLRTQNESGTSAVADLHISGRESNILFTTKIQGEGENSEVIGILDTDGNGSDCGDFFITGNGQVCALQSDDGWTVTNIDTGMLGQANNVAGCERAPLAARLYQDFVQTQFQPSQKEAAAQPDVTTDIWEKEGDTYYDLDGNGDVNPGDQIITSNGLFYDLEDTGVNGYVRFVLNKNESQIAQAPKLPDQISAAQLYDYFK